jgi:hypothetical protein
MKCRKLIIEKSLADSLVEYCERTFILPDDLVRIAIQQKPQEPFLLDARQLGGASETERMIRILHSLWKSAPDLFDKAAKDVGGHKRVWFSKDRKLISDSGSSNFSQRIGDSPWYVSTNCPYNGMMSMVEKVMRSMGFSWQYTLFVAWSICCQKGRLNEDDFFVDNKTV